MKKLVIMFLSLVMVVSLFAGCQTETGEEAEITEATEATEATETDAETMEEKAILSVGMECAYAPFNWTQSSDEVSNGDVAIPIYSSNDYAYGYDVMVAKMLADELGMELEIHKVDWSSIVLGMNAGDYDVIIAGMGYTEERDLSVDFTDPYYIRDNVIILRKDSEYASATGLSDFAGASATTQIGTIWEQYVPQIPEVEQLTYFETTSEVIMSVVTGSADCVILDEPTAMSATLSNPDLMYVKLAEDDGFTIPEGQSLDVCIAVKEGNAELQGKLDDALDAIEWDPTKMTELMNTSVTLQPLSN